MNGLLWESTQNVVTTDVLSIGANEVTTINNTSWISIHLYVV
jgi:hypothetical protein